MQLPYDIGPAIEGEDRPRFKRESQAERRGRSTLRENYSPIRSASKGSVSAVTAGAPAMRRSRPAGP